MPETPGGFGAVAMHDPPFAMREPVAVERPAGIGGACAGGRGGNCNG